MIYRQSLIAYRPYPSFRSTQRKSNNPIYLNKVITQTRQVSRAGILKKMRFPIERMSYQVLQARARQILRRALKKSNRTLKNQRRHLITRQLIP